MRKRLLQISLLAAAALLPTGSVLAQVPANQKVQPQVLKMSKAEQARAKKDLMAKYPLLSQAKRLVPRMSMFPSASLPNAVYTPMQRSKAPLLANANATIWANLVFKEGWTNDSYGPLGYYSFAPTSPLNFTSLFETQQQSVASNGVQYADGHIYGCNLDNTYANYGVYYIYLYDTDTNTGTTTRSQLDFDSQLNLVALETAQADDGTVYGEFYTSDGQGHEWGTVNYATQTRTTIGPATHVYVALGITKEGQLYGVASDGNLYKIDKTTGNEELVGPTGISVANASGGYYLQSGEIDQKDNTFYWAALDNTATGGFYEVNLQTGAATEIASGTNQLNGMVIPAPAAEDGAPAKVADVAATFVNGEHNGTIAFTAPTKTFAGDELSGNLNYVIYDGNDTLATGTAAAGEKVSKSVTVEADGSHTFNVRVSNGVGESPSSKVTVWVGYDTPRSVTNIKANANGQDVTLTWDSVKLGIHGGYVGTPTYNIYYWDGGVNFTPVAENITDTTYVDHITDGSMKYYTYAVTANSNKNESSYSTSNGIIIGDAVEPDWTEEFNSAGEWNLFTVLDANKDGRTWSYNANEGAARSYYNSDNGNDDWLFTPPIHLTPGRLYTVTFKARDAMDDYKNSLEVKWGKDTTAEAMTNTLLETTIPGGTYKTYSYDINPTEEGNYYIGFHENTELADQYYLYVDSIVVAKGSVGTAPLAVTNLKVTPGDKGAMNATITFNAPTTNVNGQAIEKVDSIQIERDGEHLTTLPAANAGAAVTYTDNTVAKSGTHEYVVTPYINGDYGQKAKASAFIGQDVPSTPQNVTLADNATNLIANWDAFTEAGANGGYVDPTQVAVSFFTIDDSGWYYEPGDSLATSAKGATSVEIPIDPEASIASDGTSQGLEQLYARADGPESQSAYVRTGSVVVGPSLNAPYKESFKGGNIENGFAWEEGNEQYQNNTYAAGWIINPDNSADNDGGAAFWQEYTQSSWLGDVTYTITSGDEVSINTPKISLKGLTNPKTYFSYYATANDPATLKVIVLTPDGAEHEAKSIDLSKTTKAGWTTDNIDLSQYVSNRFVMIKFRGVSTGSSTIIGVDNINVFDQLEYNLAATAFSVTPNVTAGKKGSAQVTVENFGSHPVSGYSVVLYANDQAVDTATVNDELPVLASDTVSLEFPVAINQTSPLNVRAEVVYANDLDEDDNATETSQVTVIPSKYAAVSDLTAEDTKAGVNLAWNKPAPGATSTVTEDFESYDAWATQFGDWTTFDGDKGLAGGFFQNYTYPGQGEPFAFDIFNPNAITSQFNVVENNPGLAPHSGNQFAGAAYAIDAATGQSFLDADNWLISPELSGKKQTIKFYAFNISSTGQSGTQTYNEKFDVLYSTEGTDTADFKKIESDVADGTNDISKSANWKEITVELPEGAKYFAIHHNSDADNSLLFGIDDVTFETGAPGSNDSIIAYNVYRDGKLVGSVKGNELVYLDTTPESGAHVYNVTVVYQSKGGAINESGFSNDASITVTGIDAITANAEGKYNVYTVDGKTVMLGAKSLKGLKQGIYIINDKKYLVK